MFTCVCVCVCVCVCACVRMARECVYVLDDIFRRSTNSGDSLISPSAF